MNKKKAVEKLVERPVLEEDSGSTLTRSEVAVALRRSEKTIKNLADRGKLAGFREVRQPGNRVLYIRESGNDSGFINPLANSDSIKESSKNQGGQAPITKFDSDSGRPVTRYEPHLTDSKNRRVAHNARTAATSSDTDDNPRFVSLSRTPMTHFPLKNGKLHCPNSPLHNTSLDELKAMSVHGVVHNNENVCQWPM